MKYPVAFEPGNDRSAWGVAVPDLPGCFSAGDTLDEAIAHVIEAIDGWCETAVDQGDEIPPPSPIEAHFPNPDFAGWVWMLLDVDIDRFLGPAERVNVTIPRVALHKIDKFLEGSGESRSAFIWRAAVEQINRATQSKSAQNAPASAPAAARKSAPQ